MTPLVISPARVVSKPCASRRQVRLLGHSDHYITDSCLRAAEAAIPRSCKRDCMRHTRAAYHYSIRKVKRDEDILINERIANSILKNDTRDFWSEIKRIRSNNSGTSRIVDGQTDKTVLA
jgi:hypothetical protein